MMHDAGHGIEGGNADEEQAVEGSRITPETPTINNDDSNRSGSQGRPKKKLRRGRPSKFSVSLMTNDIQSPISLNLEV